MRIISKIEIKNDYVIKGINLEGNRRIGEPNIFGVKYYNAGIDEIIFMDTVASLYGKNNLFELIKKISKKYFYTNHNWWRFKKDYRHFSSFKFRSR